MFYSFFIIIFLIIFQHFLIPFSNANPSVADKMLIAFMKGVQEMKISEYSMQKYEAHLGIVYFLRKNWKCENISAEFEEYERTECQKYRQYLDILYEYLYREYAGIPTVKPKFVLKRQIEIEGLIIYSVNCMAKISQFYFFKFMRQCCKHKLNKYFIYFEFFEPILLNESRLTYEFKLENESKISILPINEMILQLAIDTGNEWQTNESLDGIIKHKFEEKMKEMFKNSEERENYFKNDDKHNLIIVNSIFDDKWTWTKDALFSEFVKGFEKFFEMAKEYSNYLCRIKEKTNINWDDYDHYMISLGLYKYEKMKKHLMQRYKAHFGLMYLMRENWHCEKIGKEFKEDCQKYRKYLDILYEYLFRLYAEAKNPKVSKHLSPLVKPIFIINSDPDSLIEVVKYLNEISKCFWKKDKNELYKIDNIMVKMALKNQKELNYGINEDKSDQNSSTKNEIAIANLRKEFEQKMEKMYENSKENAKEEKEKLEKAIENAANNGEKIKLLKEYDDKFGTFASSPFS